MRFFTNPRKPMILALARPDPKKNITTLVKAFGECRPLRELANLVCYLSLHFLFLGSYIEYTVLHKLFCFTWYFISFFFCFFFVGFWGKGGGVQSNKKKINLKSQHVCWWSVTGIVVWSK